MKGSTLIICTTAAMLFASKAAFSQEVHFNPFDAAPLNINPAFTGMFDGNVRASAMYQNTWSSTTVPYNSYVLSADLPVFTDRTGNYLACGFQAMKDVAGDGNLSDFSALASLAYHKLFAIGSSGKNSDLAIGVQGGYAVKTIDLTTLYFGNNANPYPGTYRLGLGNSVNYFPVNAGISFSQATGPRFSYTAGFAAGSFFEQDNSVEKIQNDELGIAPYYNGTLGANWLIFSRLFLRPAVLFQSSQNTSTFIGGNEFRYILNNGTKRSFFNAVFAGVWCRNNTGPSFTAGTEFRNIRLCLGIDQNYPRFNYSNSSGVSIQLQYIAPRKTHSSNMRMIPCNRF